MFDVPSYVHKKTFVETKLNKSSIPGTAVLLKMQKTSITSSFVVVDVYIQKSTYHLLARHFNVQLVCCLLRLPLAILNTLNCHYHTARKGYTYRITFQ